jgi:hypothetical protein
MKKTLQDQYLLIKEGKGHTGVFLTEAKRQFPNIVRNAATFEEAAASLITKNIITENIVSLGPINSPFDSKKKESYELAFENFLAEAKKKKENEDEKVKAEEKKVSKKVEDDASHNFDNSDEKNPDNMIFDQIMMGYYAEMKDPKNADKTMQELKDMVFKNLTKDPIFYTKDGQFGVKGLGYTVDAPGLGEPKEAKGKYKASGYGDLNESIQPLNEEDKLRKVIREMVDGEIEEMRHLGSMFQSKLGDDKKEREERDPTDKYLTFDKDFEKEQRRKGNLQVRTSDGAEDRIFITKVLHSNLGPAAGNSKLVLYLQDRTNLEPAVLGGKEVWKIKGAKINSKGYISVFVPVEKSAFDSLKESIDKRLNEASLGVIDNDVAPSYPINVPISYNDDKSAAHYDNDYKYDRQEGLLDVEDYLEKIEGMSKGDAFNYLEEMGLGNDEILTILKNYKSLSLRESIDKELAAINKEAEHEIIASKLEKVQALIDKKQSQISRLDEDEDMKDLTDAKKVKEISKDIKSLERAKDKLEKMMHKGKAKPLRKAVIDEDEIIDETPIEDDNTQESLRESVEKELVAINKEAEHEIIASKLEKVQTLIDKKQTQISRLDEDEDLKDLTDAKKVKEISKDIKALEKAKAKLEKMMHKGKTKVSRKEVIDETDETIDEADKDAEDVANMAPELEKMKKTMDDMSKIELFEIDEETAAEIKEKAEQYYDEYGTLEDVLSEFENEDEKEFARRHLEDAYGL